MTMERAVAFAVFAVVAAITPGPSNVMLMAAGAAGGIVRGLPCLVGVMAGMGSMMVLVPAGLGSLVLGYPAALTGFRWLGAAFLLWLAWKIAASGPGERPAARRPVGFAEAMVFQWVNPKSWLVAASAAATHLRADGGSALVQSALLGGLFVLAALPGCFVWLAFGAAVERLLHAPRAMRAFNVALGVLLALSVVLIVG
jgi:threonine/homoserine/homoserine lactone efflux protein